MNQRNCSYLRGKTPPCGNVGQDLRNFTFWGRSQVSVFLCEIAPSLCVSSKLKFQTPCCEPDKTRLQPDQFSATGVQPLDEFCIASAWLTVPNKCSLTEKQMSE